MLRHERGVMPHFAVLDRRRLEDVIAYLRALVFPRALDPTNGRTAKETNDEVR